MKKIIGVLALISAWLYFVAGAQAGFMYHFSQSTYSVNAGQTVDVPVYLQATGNDASTLTSEGLTSAGVRVGFSGSAAAIVSPNDISGNSSFDQINPIIGSNMASVAEFTLFNPP